MYWLIFSILVVLFTYLGQRDNKFVDNKYIQNIFRLLLIITVSYTIAFSGGNFQDHESYDTFYKQCMYEKVQVSNIFVLFNDRSTGMETGYVILNKLFYLLGFNTVGFLFVIAILTNTFLVSVLYRFKNTIFNILVFITSGLYWQEPNLVRQILAVSIFLYALKYLLNKRIYMYILLIILAGLIHTSALVLLVFIPFAYIKKEYFYKIKMGLFCLWILSILSKIGLFSIDLSGILSTFSFYDNYLGNDNNVGLNSITAYALFYDICLFVYFLFRTKKGYSECNMYEVLFILGGILTNMAVTTPNIYRFSIYFTSVHTLILGVFVRQNMKNRTKQITDVIFVVFCCIYGIRIATRIIFNTSPITYGLDQIFR